MTQRVDDRNKLTIELEKGLHLHHHLGPRRERAMFAGLGFVIALAITRGITTVLHYRGAGPNGGIVIGGVHIHHLVLGDRRPAAHWLCVAASLRVGSETAIPERPMRIGSESSWPL